MSAHIYHLCNRYRGKAVHIKTRDGRVHRGIIVDVNLRKVYIRPVGGPRNFGGYGFTYGLALGAIVSLATLPFFFW